LHASIGAPAPATGKQDSDGSREALRIGARVLAAYWNEKCEFEGFWLATVKRIEPDEYTLEWFKSPGYPPFKRPQDVAVPHPARTSEIATSIIIPSAWGPSGRPSLFHAPPSSADAIPCPNLWRQKPMTSTTVTTAERVRALNDAFRRTFVGGAVMITAGVEALPVEQRRSLLTKICAFNAFTDDNDPHGEHDFGAVDEGGVRCFWKIDYYDRDMTMHSPDASDPDVTMRVLTIMRTDEY
jgi:hypothetical protein